jgi:hypothetical protein
MNKFLTLLSGFLIAVSLQGQDMRERQNFDSDWQFAFGDASDPAKDFGCGTEYFNYFTKAASIHNEGPYVMKFDASAWKTVDLPHDWVVDLPFAEEASHSHGYKQVGYEYPKTSVGWYRKVFTVPAEDYGKHIWLQFDGIFRDAQIWVNGFYLGHEKSGYATQTYDISEYLNYGEENLVCVRADATFEEGWFYEGAGIYRHVWLNKASKVHVAPFGTFVYSEFAVPYSLRGNAGEPLSPPPYGYMKSPDNKKKWIIDEEAAKVVRQIFQWCIDGKGNETIARLLQESEVLVPQAYWQSKRLGRGGKKTQPNPYKWCKTTIAKILVQQA